MSSQFYVLLTICMSLMFTLSYIYVRANLFNPATEGIKVVMNSVFMVGGHCPVSLSLAGRQVSFSFCFVLVRSMFSC